jgi:hypothetical protein
MRKRGTWDRIHGASGVDGRELLVLNFPVKISPNPGQNCPIRLSVTRGGVRLSKMGVSEYQYPSQNMLTRVTTPPVGGGHA